MNKFEFKQNNADHRKNEGFTLIEILVYIAVLAIILSAVSSFFLWANYYNAKTKAMREVLDNSRRAMEIMAYEIREAKSIYTPTSNTAQLSLETAKHLPEGENISYIDFYLCEGRLCLKKESQNPIVLTSDRVEVKNLEFSQVATTSTVPSVQINLKISYKNPQNLPELTATANSTSTASLRSY